MSARRYGWKYKPTARDLELMDEAMAARLFMVSEIGPTQFLIKGEDSPAKFKVTIGEEQTCSGCTKKAIAAAMAAAGGAANSGAKILPDLCVHIYFVMLKVLRLSRDNALVWQLSLLDTEISNILSSRYQRMEERAARRRMAVAAAGGGNAAAASASSAATAGSSTAAAASLKLPGPARVAKRDIDPDDVCPICQDELIDPFSEAGILLRSQPSAPPMLNLVFCQFGCGQQLHAKCMRVWAEHQLASGGSTAKPLACPMCRAQWGGPDGPGQLTNEQIVREIKMQEYAILPPPAAAATDDEAANDASSTALVPRAAARSSLAARSSSSSSKLGVKCGGCRKVLLLSEGRFMRCVHCADGYDLCRVCFIRSKGIGGGTVPTALLTARANHVHAFVEMKPNTHPAATAGASMHDAQSNYPYAYGSEWLPAPVKAPPLSSQLALALQDRELTHADYELLLELDENVRHNGRGMMHSYLVRTLPVPALRDGKECVMCQRAVLGSQSVRILPCFHQVHESCLQSAVMYDWLLSCPVDQAVVFPGLAYCEAKSMSRKKKPVAADSAAATPDDRSNLGALGLQVHNSFGLGLGSGGIVGNSGLSGTRSLASEEPDIAEVDARGSSSSVVVPHSHHFQLGVSAAASRLNAATAPTGRIRTGTAAFAAPSRDARHHQDASSMQLAGGSSFAPFAAALSAESSQPATAVSSAIRRGRPLDDRTNTVSAAAAAASLPADFSSLSVGAGSAPARAGPSKGVRAHGLSSMFAPPSSSPSLSPTYSPTGLDQLAISASGMQADSSTTAPTATSGRPAAVRPRVGRALPPSTSPERAPPLSQLLIGSGSAPRSSSASAARSSMGGSIKPRPAPAARSSMDGPSGIVDPAQLSLGSASGSLLSSHGSSARMGSSSASASARIRRSTLAAASVAAAAEARSEQFDSDAAAAASDLGLSASSFHRSSTQQEDSIAAPVIRGRASSASHSRPSAAFAPRTVPSLHASPPPVVSSASSFSLAGSNFNALDRGDAAPSPSVPSSAGKLRRGKTLMSSSTR